MHVTISNNTVSSYDNCIINELLIYTISELFICFNQELFRFFFTRNNNSFIPSLETPQL